jgi:peptide deformylase
MIVQDPSPILHRECWGVNYKDAKSLNKLLRKEYAEYQKSHPELRVVGMAAPQVGKSVRAFLAFNEVFINPEIVTKSPGTISVREGCCSLDDKQYQTERHFEVFVRWHNVARQLRTHTFSESQAAVIQHEVDHLNGILISDHGELVDDRETMPQVPQAN